MLFALVFVYPVKEADDWCFERRRMFTGVKNKN